MLLLYCYGLSKTGREERTWAVVAGNMNGDITTFCDLCSPQICLVYLSSLFSYITLCSEIEPRSPFRGGDIYFYRAQMAEPPSQCSSACVRVQDVFGVHLSSARSWWARSVFCTPCRTAGDRLGNEILWLWGLQSPAVTQMLCLFVHTSRGSWGSIVKSH